MGRNFVLAAGSSRKTSFPSPTQLERVLDLERRLRHLHAPYFVGLELCPRYNTMISFLISSAMASIYGYSLYFDITYQPRLGHTYYAYKLVMLTNLCLALNTCYSWLVVLTYFCSKQSVVRKLVDYLFPTVIFPVSFITCLLFWALYAINPALVMPAWVAKLIPNWLNHVTHTFPIFFILMDNILHPRRDISSIALLKNAAYLNLFYFCTIVYVKHVDGYWLYPVLSYLNWFFFLILFLLSVIIYYLVSIIGRAQNRSFWRKNRF